MNHAELLILNYLLNSLWQVPLVFLFAACAARITASAGPQIQHRIWVVALMLEVLLPACVLTPKWRGLLLSLFDRRRGSVSVQTNILNPVAAGHGNYHLAVLFADAALIVYLATLLYTTIRLLFQLHKTRVLHRTAQPSTLIGEPQDIWQRCVRVFGVHDAQLATSTAIAGPSTIGVRRRLVLLPSALLTGLSLEDLTAALAHEFAHMRRRDFLKNLIYGFITLPLNWHPVLRLTHLRLVESREMVCDELAAQASVGSLRYAHSLLRLAASLSRPRPATNLHAIGILDANVLERRVMTLTRKTTVSTAVRRFAIAATVLFGVALCASAMSLRIEVPAHYLVAAVGAQEPPNGPVRVAAGIAAGQIVSKVNPIYPPEAKAQGIQGSVVLHAIIREDGTVQQLSVISGPEELQPSAMDAVRQWVYKPYLLNGNPVKVETNITVNYALAQ
jgi:TonB family protein